jgi:hypothetical protein
MSHATQTPVLPTWSKRDALIMSLHADLADAYGVIAKLQERCQWYQAAITDQTLTPPVPEPAAPRQRHLATVTPISAAAPRS